MVNGQAQDALIVPLRVVSVQAAGVGCRSRVVEVVQP